MVTDLLTTLEERSRFDLVEDFSAIFPNEIISTVLGIPAAPTVPDPPVDR